MGQYLLPEAKHSRFLILFPGDAHRPGMAAAEPKNISRIVFKILIDQEV